MTAGVSGSFPNSRHAPDPASHDSNTCRSPLHPTTASSPIAVGRSRRGVVTELQSVEDSAVAASHENRVEREASGVGARKYTRSFHAVGLDTPLASVTQVSAVVALHASTLAGSLMFTVVPAYHAAKKTRPAL